MAAVREYYQVEDEWKKIWVDVTSLQLGKTVLATCVITMLWSKYDWGINNHTGVQAWLSVIVKCLCCL